MPQIYNININNFLFIVINEIFYLFYDQFYPVVILMWCVFLTNYNFRDFHTFFFRKSILTVF